MKVVHSILLCAFAIAPVSAFVTPAAGASRSAAVQSTMSPSQLSMIATGEMINGETKKKTREVSVVNLNTSKAEGLISPRICLSTGTSRGSDKGTSSSCCWAFDPPCRSRSKRKTRYR